MKITFAVVSLFICNILFSQDLLIPFRIKDKWGYSDVDGNMKIAPQFTYATFFEDGYAVANAERGTGLINTKGRWVIPAVFKHIELGGKANRRNFQLVITHAVVTTVNGKRGIYALPSGKMLVDTICQTTFSNWTELITVETQSGRQGVYSIRLQRWVAEPKYRMAQAISDTLLLVAEGDYTYKEIPVYASGPGKIRPHIMEQVPLEEAKIAVSADQQAAVPANTRLAEPQISPEERYKRQLLIKDNKYGFAFAFEKYRGDTIPALYDSINRSGEWIGRVGVKQDGKWGIVDSKDKVILPIRFEGVEPSGSLEEKGIFVIRHNGSKAIIRHPSQKILAEGYDEIRNEGYFYLLRKNNLWGVLFLKDANTPVLVEPQFSKVETRREDFKLKNGEEIFFLRVAGAGVNTGGWVSSKGRKYFVD